MKKSLKYRELMADVVAESDVVITTAAIPGKPSPRLITAEAVAGMQPGSVVVDLAAERGGNCELTVADQRVVEHGVQGMQLRVQRDRTDVLETRRDRPVEAPDLADDLLDAIG